MIPNNIAGHTKLVGRAFSFNTSLKFNGVDNYVSHANDGVFYDTYTISIWFNFNTLSNTLFAYDGPNRANQYIGYFLDASTIRVLNQNNVYNFTVPTMSADAWYHMVLSVSSNSARLYLNSVASSSNPKNFTDEVKIIRIGQRNGALTWDGELDEYGSKMGYAATQDDVDALWNIELGADFASVIPNPTDHYKFNSETGLIAINDGANSNGNLINFVDDDSQWVAH